MPTKILMFGWELPPYNSGGLGVACFGIARALEQNNLAVTFVLPKAFNTSPQGINVVFADRSRVVLKQIPQFFLYPYITEQGYQDIRLCSPSLFCGKNLFDEVKRYALHARLIAQEESFDLIHAHDWLSFLAGIEAKKVSGKPLVVHVHATEFDRSGGRGANARVYEIEKEGMQKADAIIAVSNFTKNIFINHYDIPEDKVRVVHNGIDEPEKTLSCSHNPLNALKRDGYKVVIFVGRLTLQKGPDYFLKAAKRVLEYNKKVFFVIAGSGDLERQIIHQSAALGIADKVLFAGFLRGEELIHLYKAADVFVMPSVSEPFGISTLESLIHNVPVIISKQSGVSEILTHALKVDFWDTEEIAHKILAVLQYQPLKSCLGEYGYHEAKKHSWELAARRCMEIYRHLLSSMQYAPVLNY